MKDALSLLTTLGRRGGALTAGALHWFPVVGALLGGLLGGWWWLAQEWWSPLLAGALVVTADLALTGMLHLDGLADTADGLLPHASREHRLAIMRTPDIGAYGITVAAMALLLRVAALGSLDADVLLLVALWSGSRSFVAAVPAAVPYAREQGIATPLLARAPRWTVVAIVPAALLAPLPVAAAAAAGAAVVAFGARRLGGFTGDVLGAAIVVAETVGLVVAAAR